MTGISGTKILFLNIYNDLKNSIDFGISFNYSKNS